MPTHKSKYIKRQLQKKMMEAVTGDFSKQSNVKNTIKGFLILGVIFLIAFLITKHVNVDSESSYFVVFILVLLSLFFVYSWFWGGSIKKKYLKEIERSYYEGKYNEPSNQSESSI